MVLQLRCQRVAGGLLLSLWAAVAAGQGQGEFEELASRKRMRDEFEAGADGLDGGVSAEMAGRRIFKVVCSFCAIVKKTIFHAVFACIQVKTAWKIVANCFRLYTTEFVSFMICFS